ncbi:MAG: hypothetical protein ABI598_06555 [Chloroflexota bacterium]
MTIMVVGALLVLGALATGRTPAPGSPTFPPAGTTTGPAGAAAATTRSLISSTLGSAGFQIQDVQTTYRPAEAARLTAAPRVVVRAVIPDDPDHGRLVIYEFVTTAVATSAAEEQAAYVASGIGQIQFPPDTQFTIRVIGSTVVFYSWSEANSPDFERATAISTALQELGFGVVVPS